MTLFPVSSSSRALLFSALLAFTALPTLAEKPDWAGGGKPDKSQQYGHKQDHKQNQKPEHEDRRGDHREDRRDNQAPGVRSPSSGALVNIQIGSYFADPQRVLVRDYYEPRMKAGKCPPGLKKKGNGCLPPGLAKDWRRGQPLPSTVVYYPVPQVVQARLGVPPAGHRFVRVASDILLIAVGTSIVIDAIENLGQR
jgi:Ni/Co efflux regulator RcnB